MGSRRRRRRRRLGPPAHQGHVEREIALLSISLKAKSAGIIGQRFRAQVENANKTSA